VADARGGLEHVVLRELLLQLSELARGADDGKLAGLDKAHACRVVAAIFEPPQALHDEGHGGTVAAVSDDAAHGLLSSLVGGSARDTPGMGPSMTVSLFLSNGGRQESGADQGLPGAFHCAPEKRGLLAPAYVFCATP
jgi:hypothetical protein